MKSYLQTVFILTAMILIGCSVRLQAQPRLMLNIGSGYYEPTAPGFDQNAELPPTNFMSRNVLLGGGVSYQFFYNARIAYEGLHSFQSGTTQSGADFSRLLSYRLISLETYYFMARRMEWNFSFAGVWGRGRIQLTTDGSPTEWTALLQSYGNSAPTISDTEKMTTNWMGFASFIGFRYYLMPWLALDVKTGFMRNYYKRDNWKLQGTTVTGPELDIGDLPLFTGRILFTW